MMCLTTKTWCDLMDSTPKTIKIHIKNSEKKLTHDHLVYQRIELDKDDPIIKNLLDECVKEFGEDPEKISVTCTLVVQ